MQIYENHLSKYFKIIFNDDRRHAEILMLPRLRLSIINQLSVINKTICLDGIDLYPAKFCPTWLFLLISQQSLYKKIAKSPSQIKYEHISHTSIAILFFAYPIKYIISSFFLLKLRSLFCHILSLAQTLAQTMRMKDEEEYKMKSIEEFSSNYFLWSNG